MTNQEMARGHLAWAKRIVAEAQAYYEQHAWGLVVRRSQEAVELALKAALRHAGFEVPKVHDVSPFLKEHGRRFRGRFAEQVDRLADISRRLRKDRELSFYGDDETNTPAEALYSEEHASAALAEARFVLEMAEDFIDL